MLLPRSKHLQLLLLVSLTTANGQQYDSEYNTDTSYNEGSSDGPDYSKYYSTDTSAPLIQSKSDAASGFVAPLEFSGFFGPGSFEFGAASNQEVAKTPKQETSGFVSPQELTTGFGEFKTNAPFGRDYFEEAQSKEKTEEEPVDKDEYEVKPGPSYISHKIVPPATPNKQSLKYGAELNDLNKDYEKDYKYNPYKALVKESDDKPEVDESRTYEEEKKPAPVYDFDFNKLPLQQYPAYPIPKQTVIDPKYLPQIASNNPASPYQKYSFQPVASNTDFNPYTAGLTNYYDKYTSGIPNYEQAPSEYVAKLLKKKNCKLVNKEVSPKNAPGRNKRQAMDCYVCKDEKSGANYEQCSYGSESNPKNYYVESSKKYSQPTKIDNYRYKRYTDKEEEKDDPYEYIKSQTQQYYTKPDDFESQYYKTKGDEKNDEQNEEYRFGPEYFKDDEEKSSSEKQSEELVKNGENCNKVQKDGMVCMVCKNSKTGGNYEQCSYSSKPAEKKYAYVKEKKYDSDDDVEEDSDGTEEKPVFGEKRKGEKGRQPEEVEHVKASSTHRQRSDADFDVPKHFEESNLKNQKKNPKGAASELYGSEVSGDYEEKPAASPHVDDYYSKIFPEYTKEESKQKEQTADPEEYGYYGEGDKKEVEEVLAEFAKKDRSTCKKAQKNGMTCYLCTDKKGLQHEECMYVSESKPQSKYASYHAKQEREEPKREESQVKPAEVASPKKKKFHKKATLEPLVSENLKVTTTALPTLAGTTTLKPSKRVYRRTKNIPASELAASATESKKSEDDKATPQDDDKYQDEGEDGAFTDETKQVFSKQLGFSLPQYMLTKSEGEVIYDEFVKSKS